MSSGRSQRHLREIYGIDSGGNTDVLPQGDVTISDYILAGPADPGGPWIEVFGGAGSVSNGQLKILAAYGGVSNDTIAPPLVQGTSYTVTWPTAPVVIATGTVTIRLGSGAGGVPVVLSNGDTQAIVIAGAGIDRIAFDDVNGPIPTGFVLTGPIIINLT